jgi:two-component system alkaline phosphatase synthesis response regulator PhoP
MTAVDDRARLRRRILLVEDEESLVVTLTDRLVAEGYDVDAAGDGDDAFEKATRGAYDLVLLDVTLPGRNGFDVCRDLRQRGSQVPVLMLTARGQVIDRVLGLKLGADDYLTKPFEMMELLARIEALFRRSRLVGTPSADSFVFGEVLLANVWGYGATPTTRTVDVHVASLRQKIETNPARPEILVTVHGLGYKFVG